MSTKPKLSRKPVPEPEDPGIYVGALEDEFRRQLHPELTLEQVRDDYLEWVENVEGLMEEFGEEATVAEIRDKLLAYDEAYRAWWNAGAKARQRAQIEALVVDYGLSKKEATKRVREQAARQAAALNGK
jgi:hypothetical protein